MKLSRQLTAGLVTGVLFVGSGCSNFEKESSPDTSMQATNQDTNEPASETVVERVDALLKGDKITELPVYKPKYGVEEEFVLTPKPELDAIQDLGVVYHEEFNKMLAEQGTSESSESLAFLVLSLGDSVAVAGILIDTKTKEVLEFGEILEVKEKQKLFSYALEDKDDSGFCAFIEPVDGGGAKLTFDGRTPYEDEDIIRAEIKRQNGLQEL